MSLNNLICVSLRLTVSYNVNFTDLLAIYHLLGSLNLFLRFFLKLSTSHELDCIFPPPTPATILHPISLHAATSNSLVTPLSPPFAQTSGLTFLNVFATCLYSGSLG